MVRVPNPRATKRSVKKPGNKMALDSDSD